jgi:septum formation protein
MKNSIVKTMERVSRLILASSSPSRLMLLQRLGYRPDLIISPDLDEKPYKQELPKNLALRLAREKALKIQENYPNDIIIAADTVCAVGRLSLPKALTEENAAFCLKKISGRRHRVYTGVCGLKGDKVILKLGVTFLQFKRITEGEAKDFIADKEQWYGKAGGYDLMGKAAAFVTFVRGDDQSNVLGLPLYYTKNIIETLKNA